MDLLLAYLDPGSGSLIVQAVVATIIAIPFFFREQFGRILKAVRRPGQARTSADASAAAELNDPGR